MVIENIFVKLQLTFSWRRPLSYRNQSIVCSANQWTGFYMITVSAMKELIAVETLFQLKSSSSLLHISFPVDTECKLNVRKMFRRRPGRHLNVLCTFNFCPVSTGLFCILCFKLHCKSQIDLRTWDFTLKSCKSCNQPKYA